MGWWVFNTWKIKIDFVIKTPGWMYHDCNQKVTIFETVSEKQFDDGYKVDNAAILVIVLSFKFL